VIGYYSFYVKKYGDEKMEYAFEVRDEVVYLNGVQL
jgi:hypothetical protein